ncbi:ABC transporter permease [Calothrix sp. UHCC 0171]|uniref:ABC transporter permease n=1 Tax=Calothrix sp. UHCC 0171 TaxID=3110245 RepID=UPI002B1F6EA7|nr:ABC transporter permease [Calothrix sp. UHCC 0171]MEA5570630.1 ABC transporter permease [Calothrix sp. UHCC 0171]
MSNRQINSLNKITEVEKYHRPKVQWLEPLLLLAPSGVWLILFLILPTLIIFELSLVPGIRPGEIVNPGKISDYSQFFNPQNWQTIWQSLTLNYARILDPLYLQVITRSLFLAIGTTAICLVITFPVAYWIAQLAPQRWRNLFLLGFVLPLWTSSLLRTYAWITILRPTGLLNTILNSIGLPTLDLLNHNSAVFIGMSYNSLPYMVLILYASLEKLDQRLLEAAADLGANPLQVFWKATIPQVITGIAASSFLVFITTLGDFVNPELLGGTSSMTVARLIYNQFLGATQNWGFGSALSMTLIMLVSIAIALLIKFGEAKPQR